MKIYCRSESRRSIAQRAAEAAISRSSESVSWLIDTCADHVPNIDVVRLKDVVNSIILSKYFNYFRKASNDEYGSPPETYEDMVEYANKYELVWVERVAIYDEDIVVNICTQFVDYIIYSYYYICLDGNIVNERASYQDFKATARKGFRA